MCLLLGPDNSYSAWAAAFIPSGQDPSMDGDADGDGDSNGFEYETNRKSLTLPTNATSFARTPDPNVVTSERQCDTTSCQPYGFYRPANKVSYQQKCDML